MSLTKSTHDREKILLAKLLLKLTILADYQAIMGVNTSRKNAIRWG